MAIVNSLPHGRADIGNPVQASVFSNFSTAIKYSSVIDTGNNNTKVVSVTGTASGTGRVGGAQGSNNNSTWTAISTGFHEYRYYRSWAQGTDTSSSISYGYVCVTDLGYVKTN